MKRMIDQKLIDKVAELTDKLFYGKKTEDSTPGVTMDLTSDEDFSIYFDDEIFMWLYSDDGAGTGGMQLGSAFIGNDLTNEEPCVGGIDGTFNVCNANSLEAASSYIKLTEDGIILIGIPDSDPGEEGALWNDEGVLKISLG